VGLLHIHSEPNVEVEIDVDVEEQSIGSSRTFALSYTDYTVLTNIHIYSYPPVGWQHRDDNVCIGGIGK